MAKTRLIQLIGSILVLALAATACGSVNNSEVKMQGDPQVQPIIENAPLDIDDNFFEPTRNEMNENFGKKIDGNVEDDIPENYLEKDEETESGR